MPTIIIRVEADFKPMLQQLEDLLGAVKVVAHKEKDGLICAVCRDIHHASGTKTPCQCGIHPDECPSFEAKEPWYKKLQTLNLEGGSAVSIRDRLILLGVLGKTEEEAKEMVKTRWTEV
jgi:hypothetical protein